jgi:hypothetical protein
MITGKGNVYLKLSPLYLWINIALLLFLYKYKGKRFTLR